ncbi:glycosyltransferase family 2 protein [Hymenobacter crusticola]|uniref:Glycosyltransferase 2-like domain-containing protein n=1 Tax=Hymenobacter crusticola TaxID=1770526 RepID=A0A243WDI5_9BACT|nr:glycosyltransferase family 2 protein [Hymenobacter crusticola]OUJ73153.1 hypothetical protein BXP70_15100 [Hymenobacter crusticola]
MSTLPLISIVTPNFNGGEYLESTILSVLEQSYPNLEYIIIDGGSTDNSIEIIKKYESRISFWVSEPDHGLYDAIQKGFDKASGDIMAWINSDDMYHAKAFFTVAEIFSSFKNVHWLQGIPTTFDEYGRTVACASLQRWSKYNYYIFNYEWIQQESVFWSKELWNKSGRKMNTNLRLAGDLELWLRFFRYEKLYVTPALIGGFRQRSKNQLSLDSLNEYRGEADSLIKSEELSKLDKRIIILYNILSKVANFIRKSRIFNVDFIVNYYERKYFHYPSVINFDRIYQKFKI